MTDRELMQQALEALTTYDGTNGEGKRRRVLAALRERLAQPEREPVAWGMMLDGQIYDCICPEEHAREEGEYTIPLYTAPTPRQWAGLTDEERNNLWREVVGWGDPSHDDEDLMKAIEAKLREKNA